MHMLYEAKNYDHLIGTEGFSDKLLKNHFTLYEGYVKNTNQLAEDLAELAKSGKQSTPQFAELKRRFGWEFDGMRLHEYYFGNLKKDAAHFSEETDFAKKLTQDFGSHAAWEKDMKATGAMRGIGWAVLYFDSVGNRLFNAWINDHDAGHLAGLVPLLVLDVFEHAFMLDYGVKKADYLDAFFRAVDWEEVQHRYSLVAYQEVSV